ncbi:hypothetical protein [Clostridium septicum]|uniref:hypothetical protein n=1 Tax=Clostridium septicum TaxID=1504 RepID=UPI000FF8F724|nr:hypothetical protein [Clostridium septicum]QAS62023.1 hypothetical protein EI377_15515 [Clostridium septicum]
MKRRFIASIIMTTLLVSNFSPVIRSGAETLTENMEESMMLDVNDKAKQGIVEIKDSNLKAEINKSIGQSADADIPESKLSIVTSLSIAYKDIKL